MSRLDEAAQYPALKDLYDRTGEIYHALDIPSDRVTQEYQKFIDGEIEFPDLTPEDIDRDIAQKTADDAIDFARGIVASKSVDSLTRAYRERALEISFSNQLLVAADQKEVKTFTRLNEILYGPVNKELTDRVTDYYIAKALRVLSTETSSETAKEAAEELISNFDKRRVALVRAEDTGLFISPEDFEIAKQRHEPFYERVLGSVSVGQTVTYEERRDILIPAIKNNLGVPEDMYPHETRRNGKKTWDISHAGKGKIEDPMATMPGVRFKGLVAGHELGTHIGERLNAMAGPLRILEIGTRGYLKATEGKGVMREVLAYDDIEAYERTPRHQTILMRSLTTDYPGSEGAVPFRKLWKIVRDVKVLTDVMTDTSGIGLSEAQTKHNRSAFDELVRNGRGGLYHPDGSVVPFRKDAIYLPGEIEQFELATENPDYVDVADLGKFNLGSQYDRQLLVDNGILKAQDK